MNRLIAVVVLVVCAALCFWVLSDSPDGPAQAPNGAAESKAGSNDAAGQQERLPDPVLAEISEINETAAWDRFPKFGARVLEANAFDPELLMQTGLTAHGLGHLYIAERCFRRLMAAMPNEPRPRLELGHVLYESARVEEARSLWLPVVNMDAMDFETLPLFGNDQLRFVERTKSIQEGEYAPDDPVRRLAEANLLFDARKPDEALPILDGLKQEAAIAKAVATLKARCHLLQGDFSGVRQQIAEGRFPARGLPLALKKKLRLQAITAQELLVLGNVFRNLERDAPATFCLFQAWTKNPNNYEANAQLAELLAKKEGSKQVSERFLKRADTIRKYEMLYASLHGSSKPPSELQLRLAVDLCLELGCFQETKLWCAIAETQYQGAKWANQIRRELLQKTTGIEDRFLPEVLAPFQLEGLNEPDWALLQQAPSASSKPDAGPTIQFANEAKAAGIDFVYDNGLPADAEQRRFFDFTGGGVAVTDIDADSWPDLLFTQGGRQPILGQPDDENAVTPATFASKEWPKDQLYLNRGGRHFDKVSEAAGIFDTGYSQGCTAGDINNDGFEDIYVANIGVNQLFVNNGDGTYSAVETSPTPRWTTSCAIADLNGDSVPDIYDVNHVTAAGIHQPMCVGSTDAIAPCDISIMQAEQDRLLLGNGDGTFRDATEESGIVAAEGIGLGIAIADFDQSGTLEVFVANDARDNFFFCRSSVDQPFAEEALARGVAVNAEGKAQACMGMAVADADRDGRLDVFITNFFADYNTLYRQTGGGFFTDHSASSSLLLPGYHRLGFGAEFFDADSDGDQDLVITNGDIANLIAQNSERPFHQPAMVLRNTSDGRFEDVSEAAGAFFSKGHLGRGLATLDWNRDGRTDFVVSHIDAAAGLLTNKTDSDPQVSMQFVSPTLARVPVGLTVRMGKQCGQLTAGDGYQSRNEPLLRFTTTGLELRRFDAIWDASITSNAALPPAGSRILVVQGREAAILPK